MLQNIVLNIIISKYGRSRRIGGFGEIHLYVGPLFTLVINKIVYFQYTITIALDFVTETEKQLFGPFNRIFEKLLYYLGLFYLLTKDYLHNIFLMITTLTCKYLENINATINNCNVSRCTGLIKIIFKN